MKVQQLGKFIRDQRRTASLSLRKLSSLAGVSNPYLSQIERGLRRPSADILQAIAKALSISAETLYIKAGILDERPEDADVVGMIRRDSTVSEKQKQILIELYQSFKAPAPPTPRTRDASQPKARKSATATKSRPAGKARATAKKAAPAKKKPAAKKPAAKKTTRRKTT
ncbi:MAG TPA: helix-turn-helix transcriptional regulator [Actinomycetota bacterium]|nr:helix-turn-helix transcriptional regulator [Actinomycetota bacterium]